MIEFKEVEKRYPNGYEALRHINLTIDQGEFVAIIGLSGAGKSTLIRTINRMHDITQGILTVDGTDVMSLHGKSLRKFRRKIGMPLKEYLNTIYLDRARELLTCSGGTVEDVAVLLGHSDVHYFYHAFRRLTGLSPGEYRAERMNFGTKTDECPEIARI